MKKEPSEVCFPKKEGQKGKKSNLMCPHKKQKCEGQKVPGREELTSDLN